MDKRTETHLATLRMRLRLAEPGITVVELFPVTCEDHTFYDLFTERCHDVASEFGRVEDIFISGETCVVTVDKCKTHR